MLSVLFYFCFSAMVVASLPLWRNSIRLKKSEGTLMSLRPASGSPLGLIDLLVTFLVWIIAQLIAISVFGSVFNVDPNELEGAGGSSQSWLAIWLAVSQLIATFIVVSFFWIRYRSWSSLGFPFKSFKLDLKIGLLAFVMVIPAILFLQWLLVQLLAYEHPTMEMLAKNANGLTLVAAWTSAVIAAPIFEEVFFRGVLQAWLQRLGAGAPDTVLVGGWDSDSKLATEESLLDGKTVGAELGSRKLTADPSHSRIGDSYWPILVTSVLFALAHVGQGPAPIPLFLFGLVLGYIFRQTSSVIPCIVLHMMLNAFSMFWFTVRVFLGEEEVDTVAACLPNILHLFFTS